MSPNAKTQWSKIALAGTVGTMALLAANPAFAQASGTTQAAAAAESEQIVVTGTRRTDRSAANSASPIDVISAAEILTQPTANVIDSLRNIIPSFFVGQNTISDASTFVRAPSLRGLSPDEIQVQLNGKRFNRSALVQVYNGGDTALSIGSQGADISSIPSIALGNLQVLRDGATAQYGSDAIAGVLNFGLRRDTGIELQARYGQFYDSGVNGQSFKNANGRSYQIAGNVGFKLGSRGFVNLSGEYTNDGQTIRNVTRPIAVAFAAANPTLAPQLPNFPGPVQIYGTSPSNAYKFVINSELEVTDSSSFYFFGNYARSSANQSFNYRSPIGAPSPFAVDIGTGTPATRSPGANGALGNLIYLTPCPTTPGNGCSPGGFVRDNNTFSFRSIYPAGFTPRFIGVTNQLFGAFGYKGKTEGGLTYDASISASRNSLALSMTNSLSASFGPQSQTSFNFGTLSQAEFNANVDLTYPIEVGFATPITLSGGFEFRRETYGSTQGDLQSYAAGPFAQQRLFDPTGEGTFVGSTVRPTASQSPGASGYGGTSPASAGEFTQSNIAFYAGAEADVTSALSVGIAGRYERYNTFGSAVVGKANAIYHFTDTFALRGTVGSGFHAPSPGQSNVEILTTSFFQGDQVQTGTYPVRSAIAQAFGARPLGPERSLNFGLGFVWEPASGISVTVDGYSIAVRNRISITNTFSVTPADLVREPALAAVGLGGAIQYFTNGFATKTQGVDVVGSWRTTTFGWNSNYTLAYNYNKSTVTSFDPAAINADRISDISNFAPKHRVVLTGNYSKDNWTVNARTNYFSSWSTQNDYPGQVFRSKFTSDLDVSYTFADHYTLTVGGNNIFNTKPDRIAPTSDNPIFNVTNSTADGQVYPRAGGPFGFNGGFWYVRVRVKY
jgi:iron complex outermembrane receptor protein